VDNFHDWRVLEKWTSTGTKGVKSQTFVDVDVSVLRWRMCLDLRGRSVLTVLSHGFVDDGLHGVVGGGEGRRHGCPYRRPCSSPDHQLPWPASPGWGHSVLPWARDFEVRVLQGPGPVEDRGQARRGDREAAGRQVG